LKLSKNTNKRKETAKAFKRKIKSFRSRFATEGNPKSGKATAKPTATAPRPRSGRALSRPSGTLSRKRERE